MPLYHLFIIYLIGTLLVFLPSFGFAGLFKKAGAPAWKAYIPFYNTWIMQQLAQRPKHWVFWQAIPVVGWFISLGIFIEFVKLFNKFSFADHALASLLAPFYFTWLGTKTDTKFTGPALVKKHKKAGWREWVDAAVFAVVAATLIRLFVFEAYTIPTGSMEKSLLINDFLFVSKLSYGPRVPNTPLSIPFVHNYIPGTHAKSYSELIKLPYIRWFAAPVKRGDAVVFNFPEGDTVINKDNYQSANPYYRIIREAGNMNTDIGRQYVLNPENRLPIAVHPVDKTDNYIKRCVGISGDTLQVINGNVYINGKMQAMPPKAYLQYEMTTNGQYLDEDVMKSEYGLDKEDLQKAVVTGTNKLRIWTTYDAMENMKKAGLAVTSTRILDNDWSEDPYAPDRFVYDNKYTPDNYGPIWIPKKGVPLPLTPQNYSTYERAIRVYEKNDFYMKDDKFYLNGKEITAYTFKMNYYWMMGDNRYNSQDSRFWGFVPEDHVVGKAWMIWFSFEKGKGPRWNRFFKIVK